MTKRLFRLQDDERFWALVDALRSNTDRTWSPTQFTLETKTTARGAGVIWDVGASLFVDERGLMAFVTVQQRPTLHKRRKPRAWHEVQEFLDRVEQAVGRRGYETD